MYSSVVKQSCALQSVPPIIPTTHLAPSTVITILLTSFPVLYFTSLLLFFFNYQPVLLIQSSNPLPLWQPYDFTYVWNLKKIINEQTKQKHTHRHRECTNIFNWTSIGINVAVYLSFKMGVSPNVFRLTCYVVNSVALYGKTILRE